MEDSNFGDRAKTPRSVVNVEENDSKQEPNGNESTSDESSSKVCSDVLTSTRLKNSDETVTTSTSDPIKPIFKTPTVLRPSQLNGNVGPQKSLFLLNPSRLNPFSRVSSEQTENEDDGQKEMATTSNSITITATTSPPKFLPLLQNGNKGETVVKTTVTSVPSTSISSSSGFVFGQNIQDRVVSENKLDDSIKSSNCTNANGTSDMLFSSALKETTPMLGADSGDSGCSSKLQCSTKSLSESAREYEESRATKRKYEEVEVKTGEEGETNVLQVICKLFAFDKTNGGSWQERGRGILRLNDLQDHQDSGNSHSRLVFRAAGSLRVVLNTKIWGEMTVQSASNKSIRLTAFDNKGEIKVFLLTGNPEDIKQLQKQLETRVKKEVEKQKRSMTSSEYGDASNSNNSENTSELDIELVTATTPD